MLRSIGINFKVIKYGFNFFYNIESRILTSLKHD